MNLKQRSEIANCIKRVLAVHSARMVFELELRDPSHPFPFFLVLVQHSSEGARVLIDQRGEEEERFGFLDVESGLLYG